MKKQTKEIIITILLAIAALAQMFWIFYEMSGRVIDSIIQMVIIIGGVLILRIIEVNRDKK